MQPVETSSQLLGFRGESTRQKKVILKWNMANPEPILTLLKKAGMVKISPRFKQLELCRIKTMDFPGLTIIPKATNCYRLRITDANGNNSYSKTLVVETFKSGDVELVGATPQVSLNDIQVDVQMKETGI